MSRSILITKRVVFLDLLQALSNLATIDYEEAEAGVASDKLIHRARNADVLVSQFTDRLSRPVLEQLKNTKLISQLGVGYDNIDINAATELGIMITNTPGVVTESTADLAFGLILAAARRIPEGHDYIHQGKWQRWTMELMMGRDVNGATLGILGMGRIGQAVARRARGFAMRVIYHNRKPLNRAEEYELGAVWVSKDELLREADFLSIHMPLNEETKHSIGETELRAMKPEAILINTSRGSVVDEPALVRALQEKWIAGAGLDVFEDEPNVHPGLLTCPNAVVAPHIGSASAQSRKKMVSMVADNVRAFLQGKQPPNLVNPLTL